MHARSRPMADDVDLMQVAQDLPGLSGKTLAFSGQHGTVNCERVLSQGTCVRGVW